MSVFSSLTNRIFFATATLAVLLTSVAIYIVTRAATRQTESELQRGIDEAATLVNRYREFQFENFGRDARLIANLPVLKAAVDTQDPATVRPIAEEYGKQLPVADLFALADKQGRIVARLGTADAPDEALAAAIIPGGSTVTERELFWPMDRGILLIKSALMPDVLGTLILGARLDLAQAAKFKQMTNSEIAFGAGGVIRVATLPEPTWPQLAPLLDKPGTSARVTLEGQDYLAFAIPLGPPGPRAQPIALSLIHI